MCQYNAQSESSMSKSERYRMPAVLFTLDLLSKKIVVIAEIKGRSKITTEYHDIVSRSRYRPISCYRHARRQPELTARCAGQISTNQIPPPEGQKASHSSFLQRATEEEDAPNRNNAFLGATSREYCWYQMRVCPTRQTPTADLSTIHAFVLLI